MGHCEHQWRARHWVAGSRLGKALNIPGPRECGVLGGSCCVAEARHGRAGSVSGAAIVVTVT